MFGRKNGRSNVSATDTLIGEGTVVQGKVVTNASLRIEGQVIGDIDCTGDITIGEKGIVHSIIQARNVFNAGSITGSVVTKGKLTITSKGSVEGDVQVGSLHVSEGGVFRGSCEMDKLSREDRQGSDGTKNNKTQLQSKKDRSGDGGSPQKNDKTAASA